MRIPRPGRVSTRMSAAKSQLIVLYAKGLVIPATEGCRSPRTQSGNVLYTTAEKVFLGKGRRRAPQAPTQGIGNYQVRLLDPAQRRRKLNAIITHKLKTIPVRLHRTNGRVGVDHTDSVL